MGRFLAVLAVMLVCYTQHISAVTDQEFQDCSAVVLSQAAKIIDLEEQLKAALGPSRTEIVHNKTIEERVALLELQMTEVQVDADLIEKDVDIYQGQTLGLEEKVYSLEGRVDDQEARINILNDNLLTGLQKANRSVSELEGRVETLEGTVADHETRITSTKENAEDLQKVNRSVSELEGRVETLEGTVADYETRITSTEGDVEELQRTDINFDARITALQENSGRNDTIAFHVARTTYSTISKNTAVKFNKIVLNEGNGYDRTTGVFTVPPSGDGQYYFSTYLLVDDGEYGRFDMRLNNDVICTAYTDMNTNGARDQVQATCSAVVSVVEGDEVKLVLRGATDNTPLYTTTSYYYNGFNGFRI